MRWDLNPIIAKRVGKESYARSNQHAADRGVHRKQQFDESRILQALRYRFVDLLPNKNGKSVRLISLVKLINTTKISARLLVGW